MQGEGERSGGDTSPHTSPPPPHLHTSTLLPPLSSTLPLLPLSPQNNDNFEESLLKLVRTLPKILKFLPSDKAKDARNFVNSLQYWLGGNQENLENLLINVAQVCACKRWGGEGTIVSCERLHV